MSDKKEEETSEESVRRIDMRALERGVRKALTIEPKNQKGKRRVKKEHPALKDTDGMSDTKAPQ